MMRLGDYRSGFKAGSHLQRWFAQRDSFALPASSQAYYWSPEWQQAEKEAMEEHRRGESVSFDRPEDAIQWLLAD